MSGGSYNGEKEKNEQGRQRKCTDAPWRPAMRKQSATVITSRQRTILCRCLLSFPSDLSQPTSFHWLSFRISVHRSPFPFSLFAFCQFPRSDFFSSSSALFSFLALKLFLDENSQMMAALVRRWILSFGLLHPAVCFLFLWFSSNPDFMLLQ